MPADDRLTIASSHPGAQLELRWIDEETTRVTIRHKGLVAESDGWWNDYVEEPSSLINFFEDLAAHWKGWDGTKEWRAMERPFLLACTHDGVGRILLDVELGSGWHDDPWNVKVRIGLDPGVLAQLASNLRAFLSRNPIR